MNPAAATNPGAGVGLARNPLQHGTDGHPGPGDVIAVQQTPVRRAPSSLAPPDQPAVRRPSEISHMEQRDLLKEPGAGGGAEESFSVYKKVRLSYSDVAVCFAFVVFTLILVGFWVLYSAAEVHPLLKRRQEAERITTALESDAPELRSPEQDGVDDRPPTTSETGTAVSFEEHASGNEERGEDTEDWTSDSAGFETND